MRLILIALLLAGVIWLIVAGFRNRRRFSFFGIFLLVIPAGVLGYFEYDWQQDQAQISEVVQEVTGNDETSFMCQRLSFGFFDAEVADPVIDTSDTQVHLKYGPCSYLLEWYNQEDKGQYSSRQVEALGLLTSEIIRLTGEQDLAVRECLTVRNNSAVAQLLGATPEVANSMALFYQANISNFSDNPVGC